MNTTTTPGAHGVKWGIIIGVIYVILLFLRFNMGETNPLIFSGLAVVSFCVVVILLFVAGFNLRKRMGGYIELKDAFKSLFYAVLIFELFYALFNFIYLKYINPDFFYHFRDATEKLLVESKQSQAEIDKMLGQIDVDAPKNMGFFDFLKGYLFWVALTGAIAFVISLIVKRKPDPSTIQQRDFLDSNS